MNGGLLRGGSVLHKVMLVSLSSLQKQFLHGGSVLHRVMLIPLSSLH